MSVQSQVNELGIVRHAVHDLEAQHARVRQQYEDELALLQEQLQRAESSASRSPFSRRPLDNEAMRAEGIVDTM